MNWTECEKAIAEILRETYEKCHGNYNMVTRDTFVALAESNIASFINEHFGLEPDKSTVAGAGAEHYCEEVIQMEDHGSEGVEKIRCEKPARDDFNGRFLCPEHFKLAWDRWKAQGSRLMSERPHLEPDKT